MNIGEAAAASGVSAKMIRYYESTRLIPEVSRSVAGYRIYSSDDVSRLIFVRRARDLGFPVEGIRELLALWQDKSRSSADVKQLAQLQIEELNLKIKELVSMVHTLEHLAEACHGDDRPDCPIIDTLSEDAATEPVAARPSKTVPGFSPIAKKVQAAR